MERERLRFDASGVRIFTVDLELTNRCNAGCSFCPRDRVPHQGLMAREVFERALARVVEFREQVEALPAEVGLSFCGLGEELLHPRLPDYVRASVDAGFAPSVCSNGALLDERRTDALLDAGLDRIYINCGDIAEDYDEVYGMPFDRLVSNVDRFMERSAGRCEVHIVLVDHRLDDSSVESVRRFWLGRGVTHFFESPMLNRAGSLVVESMDYTDPVARQAATDFFDSQEVVPACTAPLFFPFIGYDGGYYLCSSDWEKQVSFGSVFDRSLAELVPDKRAAVVNRKPICVTCNHDPMNRMIAALRGQGDADPASDLMPVAIREKRLSAAWTTELSRWHEAGLIRADGGGLAIRDSSAQRRPRSRLIPLTVR